MYHVVGMSGLGCCGLAPMGADTPPTTDATVSSGTSSTTWIAGGLIVLLAIGALALEKKGPAALRA